MSVGGSPVFIRSYEEFVEVYGHGPPPFRLVTKLDYEIAARCASRWVRHLVVRDVEDDPDLGPGVVELRMRGPLGLPLPRYVTRRVAAFVRERGALNIELRLS